MRFGHALALPHAAGDDDAGFRIFRQIIIRTVQPRTEGRRGNLPAHRRAQHDQAIRARFHRRRSTPRDQRRDHRKAQGKRRIAADERPFDHAPESLGKDQAHTIIDDFGTQELNMPGSITVKYPVNLQGFLETIYSLTGGDPEKIKLVE